MLSSIDKIWVVPRLIIVRPLVSRGRIFYYIYQMKANQAKLNYLIKMAKMKGITVDMINDIKYRLSSDEEVG